MFNSSLINLNYLFLFIPELLINFIIFFFMMIFNIDITEHFYSIVIEQLSFLKKIIIIINTKNIKSP